MAGRGPYPWVRLTHPVEVEPARDSDGWVISRPFWQHAEVVPLSGHRSVPVVALLGERGFGKSFVLVREREDRKAAGVEDPRLVNLKALSTRQIESRVGAALSPGWDGVRWVLLDGLDDAPVAAEIDRMLIGALHELGDEHRHRLRLRVSCRTSRWPTLLSDTLEELWG